MSDPLTPARRAEIDALAEKATPGPWKVGRYPNPPIGDALTIETVAVHPQLEREDTVVGISIGIGKHRETVWMEERDAAYIASVDPSTWLALSAALREAEARVTVLETALREFGLHRAMCPQARGIQFRDPSQPCDCGLAAALNGATTP